MKYFFCVAFFIAGLQLSGQNFDQSIKLKKLKLDSLNNEIETVQLAIEDLKLNKLRQDIFKVGLPSEDYIQHSAMYISYNDHHKQANWVAHMITPDIINGSQSRTNDFRADPKLEGRTAVEEDYFLTIEQADGTLEYDGFGYDRGHLAPSADFRWSKKALSESYYYSNIAPQVDVFNRSSWRALEDALRSYIYNHKTAQLYVVTMPILSDSLGVIARSQYNQISVPEYFIKLALDLKNRRAIGFKMPNKQTDEKLESYAISIDEAERITDFDFFKNLPDDIEDQVESQYNVKLWIQPDPESVIDPINPQLLRPGQYNSKMALQKRLNGQKVTVCGNLVSARKSRSGNFWANLDAPYPNAHCSFWIRKEHLIQFESLPDQLYMDQNICVEGFIKNYGDNISIEIKNDEAVTAFKPKI